MSNNELINDWFARQGGKPILAPDLSFYESSWDLLMPVVEKICTKGHFVQITWTSDIIVTMASNDGRGWTQRTKRQGKALKAIYLAIVEFIKWDNEQTQ